MNGAIENSYPAADAQDPRRVDPELLRRYDVRGPRYTSYPPANHFAEVDPERVAEAWRARRTLADDPGLALYLHVPFCAARCAFCGCHTATDRPAPEIDAYVEALRAEMAHAAGVVSAVRVVRQVAIGGGTPNYLAADRIERLLAGMEESFRIAADAECSVEINPRTATAEKIERFVAHRFNRFSLGVQDLDDAIIGPLRPGASRAHVRRVAGILRANGIEHINFDLIYGLPGQTLETMTRGAEALVELQPTRVALYSYAHVPWLHPHQEALAARGLPGGEEKVQLYLRVMDVLRAGGYVPIGMDHFARPEDPLARAAANGTLHRNFMGYTTQRGLDLVAFGASGIAAVGPVYSQNIKDTAAYLAAVAQGRLPVYRGYFLSRDDEIRRELLLDVFCNFEVDLAALGRRFGIDPASYFADDLARLAPMVADGLVEADAARVAMTPRGRFFVRNVCMAFDRHLESVAGEQLYSRTVTERVGVLLLNLGGPAGPDEVRPFIRDLLSEPDVIGLPWPASALLASVIAARRWRHVLAHYDAIGGRSPIGAATADQARGLAERLGPGFVVRHAFAFSAPRIPAAVDALAAAGVRRLVALPLFPHESQSTTRVVLVALEKAARGRVEVVACGSHADAPGYVEALAEGILARLGDAQHVLVSAHGLPLKLARRDTYVADVERTFAALETRLAGRVPLSLAYQSRVGRMRWTEPYLTDEIARLAAAGVRRLLVAPISFACENLETLYELDVELPPLARALGAVSIARAPAPGTHPAYMDALAALVRGALDGARELRHAV